MKISGFTYIRNGLITGYPFLQSINSILPICDEFIIAVGDSTDGTRESVSGINSKKIKIIDTVWDESLRKSGKIFSQQANIALSHTTGDWLFHIQADELIHEKNHVDILGHISSVDKNENVDGLLFDFLNFYGTYDYLNNTRYQHKKEIRLIRSNKNIFSYRDSQGFRKYPSYESYLQGHKGFKLKVKDTKIPVFHYNYARHPKLIHAKSKNFDFFYHDDEYLNKKYQDKTEADIYNIERVKRFSGSHPSVMKDIIQNVNWNFDPLKIFRKLSLKDKVAYFIEDIIKYRIGEYKNYIIVK